MVFSNNSNAWVARRLLLGLLQGFMLALLVGCQSDESVTRLKIGHTLDPSHTVHKAMLVYCVAWVQGVATQYTRPCWC